MYRQELIKTPNKSVILPAYGNRLDRLLGRRLYGNPWILEIGRPLAGKGTQAQFLREMFGLKYASTGDWVRYHIKELLEGRPTPFGGKIKQYSDEGKLVPDSLIIEIFEWGADEYDLWRNPALIDGFPRTDRQRRYIEWVHPITLALLLDVPEGIIREQRMGRLTCRLDSSHTFHPKTNPPKAEGKCDHDDGELYVRKDDDPKVVERRLKEYDAALPVVDFYANKGRLLTVNGVAGIQDISTVLAYQVGFVLAEVEKSHGRDPALIMDKMVQFYKS